MILYGPIRWPSASRSVGPTNWPSAVATTVDTVPVDRADTIPTMGTTAARGPSLTRAPPRRGRALAVGVTTVDLQESARVGEGVELGGQIASEGGVLEQ